MNIVGVTSCIAGLAHTPMAAKSLEKEGGRLGHQIKIEQQGAMGIMNRITDDDIQAADFVLIAADRTIEEEERFAGKVIIRVKIGQCVSHASDVITKCVSAVEARLNK
ncbi:MULTISPECIES: PTS fructose transporter subunit IIB [Buttiauxella]|jgi:PTS system fructose-specific IIB component|uniref:protein-N(pi)-phosphohistidine--D-fructose phosphotransferase n=1 Tax=Buttiauxella ferragutiae ATCC 51602 TaxID=1354252 RepID=A0ABX2W7K6_9ENTR|nr:MULTISPECIES: fructose PTS transporter subunit IIB [Buttiauxella]AYN29670.1 PTS fructose transporter subunit IIB [Buttiauxella sp. 3AFRM03]MCE0826626.1 fructose PTS transporter subunit IIB [Buttiauxella ferragutiae]OAT27143.1 PTS system fructose-specific IIB component [Buttiauxella ferragutiae ATCC 51602]TDN55173.1 PTS system IIB component (Fru family) [Buttiauxella sp. JUb87]UNK62795.1 fructose PTS transporter subunit IIB [Buttiauxella ferragutiae]